jgi:L-ascorbate metabolism protein UlaG (beta-lactamase superfamily)
MQVKDSYRLGDSTVVEPLVNNWVAWSHVISPVAASLHLKNYQNKILEAYVKDPKSHADACKSPRMRSGHFVNLSVERAAEAALLLEETKLRRRENLRLAEGLVEFHNRLVAEAKGYALEPFYAELPPELRGYVELVYDYYNRPSVRPIEGLLYESDYYDEGLQSLRLFKLGRDSDRPFFMNTPRLPEQDEPRLQMPFASARLDGLFGLDSSPRPLGHIREMLGLRPSDEALLRPLLSESPAVGREAWGGVGARVTYLGHACVLVEWNGVSILTDPCVSVSPSEGGAERFTYRDLPERIDYALITHNHHDHFCVETLLRLRHKIGCLVVPRSPGILYGDLSLKLLAKKIGFGNVVELDALESLALPGGEIVAVPFMGEHADLAYGKSAYVVRAGRNQILFAADSDCLDENMYRHVRRALGPIQTVFLGMECVGAPLSWSSGAFLPERPAYGVDQSRRYKGCDAGRGLTLLKAVGARRVFIYAMGLEPWFEYLLGLAYGPEAVQLKEAEKLLARFREEGLDEARLLSGKGEIFLPAHADEPAPRAAVS